MKEHPDVYPPSEDTELLARVLRREEPALDGAWCADVGTGTGAIASTLQALGARVVAVDVSPVAARLARENLGGRADVARGDLAGALRGPFAVVAFNAPYLPSEPHERVEGWLDHAFHGGEGGVETSERFARDLPRVLAPDGRAYLVVSSRADLDRLRAACEAADLGVEKLDAERWFFEEVAIWRLRPGRRRWI